MSAIDADISGDETEALTVRPGLWPWVDDNGKVTMWVVVNGFWIDGGRYMVPDGFITDLASIPTWLHWLFNPFSPETAVPAAGHDFLLKLGVDERVAAGIFYEMMRDWQTPRWKRKLYFWAVLFAARGW